MNGLSLIPEPFHFRIDIEQRKSLAKEGGRRLNDRLEWRSEESVKETPAKALGEHLTSHEN